MVPISSKYVDIYHIFRKRYHMEKEMTVHHTATLQLRTIPDPEFPGEPDEKLYFVMVELNMDDIKELKRVTMLEMQGSLDQDGLKAFVEVSRCTYWCLKYLLIVQFFLFTKEIQSRGQ